MALNARIRFARVVRAAAVLFTASCVACCDDEPVVNPAIGSVEIIPARVSVPAGVSFQVRARVRDEWKNLLPDQRAAGVTWTSPGGLDVAGGTGNPVTITANSTATPPVAAELIVSIDDHSDTTIVTIVDATPKAGANVDWIANEFDPKDPPTPALVTGVAVGTSQIVRIDTVIAFASQGPLDTFECIPAPAKCGDVIIFPPRHAPMRMPANWTSGCDLVSFVEALTIQAALCGSINPPPPLPLKPPVHVPVFIWKASSAWGLDGHIAKDVEHARRVIEQVWSGLKLEVLQKDTYSTSIVRGPLCHSGDENDVGAQLAAIAGEFKKDRISVVYVQDISVADPAVPGGSIPTGELAYTCEPSTSKGTIILIAGSGRLNTHLAHEFGHALGEWPGAPVHPDWLEGFDASNLMWSEETDRYRATRENLTLGQWFQMTLAQSAFIRRAGLSDPVLEACQAEFAYDGFCPWLGKDISR